jgi:hypothetical protein
MEDIGGNQWLLEPFSAQLSIVSLVGSLRSWPRIAHAPPDRPADASS